MRAKQSSVFVILSRIAARIGTICLTPVRARLKNTGLTLKECKVKTTNRQWITFGGVIKNLQSVLRWSLAAALLFALAIVSAPAQQITGSIRGMVKDEQGALVAGATVTATNVETGLSRSAPSNSEGGYYI